LLEGSLPGQQFVYVYHPVKFFIICALLIIALVSVAEARKSGFALKKFNMRVRSKLHLRARLRA